LQQQPAHRALHESSRSGVSISLSYVSVARELLHYRLVHRVAEGSLAECVQNGLRTGRLWTGRLEGLMLLTCIVLELPSLHERRHHHHRHRHRRRLKRFNMA